MGRYISPDGHAVSSKLQFFAKPFAVGHLLAWPRWLIDRRHAA
jgi:hypothetical protein